MPQISPVLRDPGIADVYRVEDAQQSQHRNSHDSHEFRNSNVSAQACRAAVALYEARSSQKNP